jgi:hypothetical protein
MRGADARGVTFVRIPEGMETDAAFLRSSGSRKFSAVRGSVVMAVCVTLPSYETCL